jgi:hypothetical protein
MSPTRRDILKSIAALGVGAALPAPPAVTASEPVKPVHVFDSDAIRFDVDELLDAYCPEYLEGMIVVKDPHTNRRHELKIELFSDGRERTEIRLTDLLDDTKSITIGSATASQYRLMVATASQYRLMVAIAG